MPLPSPEIYLPFITISTGPQAPQPADNREICILWIGLSEQCRPAMEMDDHLMMYAAWRVSDILTHTDPPSHKASNGLWTNDNMRRMGVWLPPWYQTGDEANNCESIAWNSKTPERAIERLLESPLHRAHVLATEWTYYEQILIGAAWGVNTERTGDQWWTCCLLVSAPQQHDWDGPVG